VVNGAKELPMTLTESYRRLEGICLEGEIERLQLLSRERTGLTKVLVTKGKTTDRDSCRDSVLKAI
jgi:hypothetical protein